MRETHYVTYLVEDVDVQWRLAAARCVVYPDCSRDDPDEHVDERVLHHAVRDLKRSISEGGGQVEGGGDGRTRFSAFASPRNLIVDVARFEDPIGMTFITTEISSSPAMVPRCALWMMKYRRA